MKQLIGILSIVVLTPFITTAQSGELTGKVFDALTQEPVPYASMQLYVVKSDVPEYQGGLAADEFGQYTFQALPPGDYILRTSMVGYTTDSAIHRITEGELEVYNPKLVAGIMGKDVIVHGDADAIDFSDPPSIVITTTPQLKRMPTRNPIGAAVARSTKVYDAKGDGSQLNFGGSRSNANALYIDGVRVTGSDNLPMGAVSSVSVYTGGIPARYGDFTGGVIDIKTRSYEYFTTGF